MGLWYNTNGLSVDELMKKETEVRKKLVTAFGLGIDPNAIGQIQNALDDIRLAIVESQYKPGDDADENFDDYLNIG